MSEQHDYEKLEEQRDLFTFVISLFFVCIISSVAHGFYGFAAIRLGNADPDIPVNILKVFSVAALYVFPGLLSGFVWRKWGVVIGAVLGIGARLLSLINLGFLVPYAKGSMFYSFDDAVEAIPSLFVLLLGSAAAGLIAGAVGYSLREVGPWKPRCFRFARNAGLALVTSGFVAGGGLWLFGFLPYGKRRGLQTLLQRMERISDFADAPLGAIVSVGAVLVVICIVVAALSLPRILERAFEKKDVHH